MWRLVATNVRSIDDWPEWSPVNYLVPQSGGAGGCGADDEGGDEEGDPSDAAWALVTKRDGWRAVAALLLGLAMHLL